MNFLVIQHLDIEPPALIGDTLEQAGHQLTRIHLDQGNLIPAATDFDGIIIMGGPQSANNDTDYILAELAWLKKAIAADIPMLGICLGAQMIAKAAGADIFTSPVRELGWFPVYHTDEAVTDPLFCQMPNALAVFQWHGETFSFTDAMAAVAMHPDVPAQAFRLGKSQYGLQFHVEIDQSIIEGWIAHGENERKHLDPGGIKLLHKNTTLYLESMRQFCKQMVHAWLMDINHKIR
ncbi:MAG: type 1 glutamine amidotransferase [Mariprofundus sp.]|nr:type 1 glutamine amidotransferase [Mariprofundus sp.]